jgi:hypothetical protein
MSSEFPQMCASFVLSKYDSVPSESVRVRRSGRVQKNAPISPGSLGRQAIRF